MKLQLLSNSNGVLATELVGVDDDYQTFSYAYRFTTNQGGFLCRRYDVFDAVGLRCCDVRWALGKFRIVMLPDGYVTVLFRTKSARNESFFFLLPRYRRNVSPPRNGLVSTTSPSGPRRLVIFRSNGSKW
jgi:hypothetical protein